MLISTVSKFVQLNGRLSSSFPRGESGVSTLEFPLRNSGAISLSSNGKSQLTQASAVTLRGTGVRILVQMLLASQVIWLTFLEKPLHVQNLRNLLGRFFISRSKGLHSSISLLVPRKLAVTTVNLHQCDKEFLGHLNCYPCYSETEGNTLAATEFIRLLEVSGPITAKQSNGTRENTQLLGSNSRGLLIQHAQNIERETQPKHNQNVTQCGIVVSGVPPPGV